VWRHEAGGWLRRACLASLLALAINAQAAEPARQRSAFQIEPQSLADALIAYSEQSGLQLVAVGDLSKAPTTSGVRGLLPNEVALRALLSRSGYTYVFQANGVITVAPAAPVASAAGPAIAEPVPKELAGIQVTARRRAERRIDVPMAVTALDGDQLGAMGLANVARAIDSVPGASSVDIGGGFTQVQIRGVSSSLGGNDNGYYLDEIPFTGVTVPWHPDTRSFDLDRVEVLRGPQGTLFGEGSMGGTVRILTRRPVLNQFDAALELGVSAASGGGGGWSAKAITNLPLIDDRLAVRVVATDESLPGWVDNTATGENNINTQRIRTGRLRARFLPTDRWTLDAAAWSYRSAAPGGGYASDDDMQVSYYYARDADWNTANLVSSWEGDHTTLTYTWAQADLRQQQYGDYLPGILYDGVIDIGVRTQELRWASTGDGPLSWTLGLYDRQAERRDRSLVGSTASASGQRNEAYALFGDVTWQLPNPAWSLNAGLRFFSDDVTGASLTGATQSRIDARFQSWNPRIGLAWAPRADATVYASVAKGFRSGQLQPATSLLMAEAAGLALPTTIDPDRIVTAEVGGKWLLDEGRVLLEGALYQSRWHEVPVRVPINDSFNGILNSEGADIRGAEVGVTWSPVPALALQLETSWIDATYRADVPGTNIHAGTPVYNTPRLSLDASIAYRWPLARDRQGVARVGVRYHSERQVSLTQGVPGDPILAADLRLGIEAAQGWAVYLVGDNLTDEQGAVDARTTRGYATRLRPRTLGLEFRIGYD
jgi:outer membrane receptor protein involved in Fe transport